MNHHRATPLALSLLAALLLPGCTASSAQTSTGRYPSLLPRAIEKRGDAEPVAEAEAAKAEPGLDVQIATLTKAQADAAATIAPAIARADRATAAAKGAAAGSERWIAAQIALAELDGFRADASARLSDIEQIAITRGADGLPEYPPLEAARAAAQEDLDAQAARIERLQAMLAGS